MNENVINYIENLFVDIKNKDCKVTEQDIENFEEKYKSKSIVFPKELKEFYIKYNEILFNNLRINNITLIPLISDFDGTFTVELGFNIVPRQYNGREKLFLDGLIPIGVSAIGDIAFYKIDDKSIIVYEVKSKDENDYNILSESLNDFFNNIDIKLKENVILLIDEMLNENEKIGLNLSKIMKLVPFGLLLWKNFDSLKDRFTATEIYLSTENEYLLKKKSVIKLLYEFDELSINIKETRALKKAEKLIFKTIRELEPNLHFTDGSTCSELQYYPCPMQLYNKLEFDYEPILL